MKVIPSRGWHVLNHTHTTVELPKCPPDLNQEASKLQPETTLQLRYKVSKHPEWHSGGRIVSQTGSPKLSQNILLTTLHRMIMTPFWHWPARPTNRKSGPSRNLGHECSTLLSA